MGASKTNLFTIENLDIALLSRAFAHPARVRIVELLRENSDCRNTDLSRILQLSKSTIYDHLMKLKQAELVHFKYHETGYLVSLEKSRFSKLISFLEDSKS